MSRLLSDKHNPGTCLIQSVTGDLAPRLLEMGITPGSTIEIIRTAPLGFPVEIKIRGYSLSLREEEARCIELES
ncbi:MAG: FeoA family protein [Balneolaceae bacterium]